MNTLLSAGRRKPHDLRPHPLNEEIYGDHADDDLIQSIKAKGILSPLLVTHDNRIISGHRRWDASVSLRLEDIPIVVFGSQDELEIQEALIESNRQRTKSNEQIGREYKHLKRIYNARDSKQGKRTDLTSDKPLSEVPPTRKAAEKIGVSQPTANKAEQVVDTIDQLESEGDKPSAEHLRQKLETSVNGAHKEAKDAGLIQAKKPVELRGGPFAITLDTWQKASDQEHEEWLYAQHGSKSKLNDTNDNVEWALWTWNPITGCLHNCSYCYARDIANRFYTHLPDGEHFTPAFYPDRLSAPANTKVPDITQVGSAARRVGLRNIFTCSMADLFGKWVPAEWIHAVIKQVANNPQWTFLFLTKFPIRMAEFDFPPNTWIGTTVDSQYAVERAEKAFRKIRAGGYEGVAWLSCEPMMERLTFSSLDMFDWVVMGGSSKSTQTPAFAPPPEWWIHLWNQAKEHGIPIYMKTNLIQQHGNAVDFDGRVREYPARAFGE